MIEIQTADIPDININSISDLRFLQEKILTFI